MCMVDSYSQLEMRVWAYSHYVQDKSPQLCAVCVLCTRVSTLGMYPSINIRDVPEFQH